MSRKVDLRVSERPLFGDQRQNTAAVVWADSAYRSGANEEFLARNGFVSRIHRKKPPGRPMPAPMPGAMRWCAACCAPRSPWGCIG